LGLELGKPSKLPWYNVASVLPRSRGVSGFFQGIQLNVQVHTTKIRGERIELVKSVGGELHVDNTSK
jgi:hypothetical protein